MDSGWLGIAAQFLLCSAAGPGNLCGTTTAPNPIQLPPAPLCWAHQGDARLAEAHHALLPRQPVDALHQLLQVAMVLLRENLGGGLRGRVEAVEGS